MVRPVPIVVPDGHTVSKACTKSLPTSEVKRHRARLITGWGTAREVLKVLSASHLSLRFLFAEIFEERRAEKIDIDIYI